MKALSTGQSLRWLQSDERSFSLSGPNQAVFATLSFQTECGSLANASTAAGSWTLKRVGFFKPAVSVRPVGSETPVALFRLARLRMAGGRVVLWKPRNIRRTEISLETAAGRRILLLKPEFGAHKHEASVKIESADIGSVELSIVVVTSWHVALLLQKDEAVATAGTAIAMMAMMT
jgi:hypothetical protein